MNEKRSKSSPRTHQFLQVATEATFADALKSWFESGPRVGVLKDYPYRDFDGYVQAYAADVIATVGT